MMLLNTLDLVFCLSSTLVLITGALYASNNHVLFVSFSVFNFLYCVLLEATAFVTCTLTITRTLSLWFPFYLIKKKKLCGMLALYLLYLLSKGGFYLYVYHTNHPGMEQIGNAYDTLGLLTISTMVICVMLATIISIIRLRITRKQDLGCQRITENTREATKTVMILSGLFLVFNLVFLVMLSLQVAGCDPVSGCLSRVVYEIGMQGIPLNSAINPLVYFCRNKMMFQFVKDSFRNICVRSNYIGRCFSLFTFMAYLKGHS